MIFIECRHKISHKMANCLAKLFIPSYRKVQHDYKAEVITLIIKTL